MTEKETTSGGARWRKRAIASVGVAAAVASVGIGAAGSAGAVAPGALTIKLTAPTTLANNNINPGGSQNLTLEIINTDKVNQAVGDLTLTVTRPSTLLCSNIRLGTPSANPAGAAYIPAFGTLQQSATSATTCTSVIGATIPANSDNTFTYPLTINGAGQSGTISATVSTPAADVNGNGGTLSSNTTTSTLSSPSSVAPTFTTTKVPDPALYNGYNFQILTSPGDPTNGGAGGGTPTTYHAYGYATEPNSTTGRYSSTLVAAPAAASYVIPSQTPNAPAAASTTVNHANLDLGNGFVFDEITGAIVFAGTNQTANKGMDSDEHTLVTPFDGAAMSWYIVANDGLGGASTATPAGVGGVTPPTPAVLAHDVVSAVFNSVRVFSDVAVNQTFATAIYTLAYNDVTSGFANGTFQPGAEIERQAFAHFLAEALDQQGQNITTGPCTTNAPSSFSDVPNTNPFCREIRSLSRLGIINGFKDSSFHPGDAIDRQAISAMLYRTDALIRTGAVADSDPTCTSKPFSDVNTTNQFCGDIAYLKNLGVVKGFSDGTFRPASHSERQATASFLYQLGQTEGAAYVDTP